MEIPAVSVIVPLYNSEKYIGECLDSLFAQTLKNFEVIVVDDCSTDKSVTIVESYAEKFGGRLILMSFEKNSGNAGYTARNKALNLSRGEYIFFVDADDMLTDIALEWLYKFAKKSEAEVVYTGARYLYTATGGAQFKRDKHGRNLEKAGGEDKAILMINKPHKILQQLLIERGLFHTAWTKFVKRDFLAANEITFYETISGGDYIWTIEIFARAKRFLRLPRAVYLYRDDSIESMTRSKKSTAAQILKWSKIFVQWAKHLSALNEKVDILKKNPRYAREALSFWINFCFRHNGQERTHLKSQAVYEILRQEFTEDLTVPFLISVLDEQQKNSVALKKRIAVLESELKQLKSLA